MGKKSKKPKAPKVAPPATKEKVWIPLSDTTTVNGLNVLDTMCKHGLDTSEVTFESEGVIFTKSFLEREDYETIAWQTGCWIILMSILACGTMLKTDNSQLIHWLPSELT